MKNDLKVGNCYLRAFPDPFTDATNYYYYIITGLSLNFVKYYCIKNILQKPIYNKNSTSLQFFEVFLTPKLKYLGKLPKNKLKNLDTANVLLFLHEHGGVYG